MRILIATSSDLLWPSRLRILKAKSNCVSEPIIDIDAVVAQLKFSDLHKKPF